MQTNEEATVYVYDLDLFVTLQILEDTPAVCRLENSAKITDNHMSGPVVRNRIWSKMAENPMQHGKLCAYRCPRIINRFLQLECKCVSYIVNAGLHRRFLVKAAAIRRRSQQSTTWKPVARYYRTPKHK